MLGILGAMEEEVRLLRDLLADQRTVEVGPRTFVVGTMEGIPAVVGISGFGKVAAASTVTSMIDREVTSLIFTGVAGGVGDGMAIGDVVVADSLVQHDFDASPIFPRRVIPSLGTDRIRADRRIASALAAGAQSALARLQGEAGSTPRVVHRGIAASGDQFIDDADYTERLKEEIPGVLAVEMEGAAVAQVCAERGVPFGVVRTISDTADADAAHHFARFIATVAAPLAARIVPAAIRMLRQDPSWVPNVTG